MRLLIPMVTRALVLSSSPQKTYITGVATFTTGVTTQLNAENIDAGITTTTDLYVENLLYDSNSQIGVGNSVLVTQGGKLVWTTLDLAGIATFFRPGSTFYVSENGTDSSESDGLSPRKHGLA